MDAWAVNTGRQAGGPTHARGQQAFTVEVERREARQLSDNERQLLEAVVRKIEHLQLRPSVDGRRQYAELVLGEDGGLEAAPLGDVRRQRLDGVVAQQDGADAATQRERFCRHRIQAEVIECQLAAGGRRRDRGLGRLLAVHCASEWRLAS